MQVEGIAQTGEAFGETESIRAMIAEASKQAKMMTQANLSASNEMQRNLARNEIETMNFNVERAMANEMANRTLSKMFGSFSLVQKIMQNMG